MKLKKIASLMLAGVMAVSMLTACGSNAIDEQPPVDNGNDTTVTGYSAKLQSELSAVSQSKLKLSDDADLNKALEYAVGNIGNDSLTAGFFYSAIKGGNVYYLPSNVGYDSAVRVVNDVRDALDVHSGLTWHQDVGTSILMLNPTSGVYNATTDKLANGDNKYDKDNVNTVIVFAVNDGVNLNNVMDNIASQIDSTIQELDDNYDINGDGKGDVSYNYTGSVATCNKNYEAGHGMGLNFVAVELVRHIGK